MKKNAVAHFEIYADDPDALQRFYSELFDWTMQPVAGMDYRFIQTVDTDPQGMPTQPGGINGGMAKRPDGYKTRAWMNYVNVESLDTSVARAQQLGARVMRARTPVPGMGWFAMLTDPQGNEFAMWQTDAGAK
jgi:uncharacterized protein